MPDGSARRDARLVDQPRPRAVGRVVGVPLPGRERGQERGPRCRPDRISLLERLQAAGLGRGAQLGGIGRGQVAQRGADHVQRLVGTGKDRDRTHPGHLLHRAKSLLLAVLRLKAHPSAGWARLAHHWSLRLHRPLNASGPAPYPTYESGGVAILFLTHPHTKK
jgi:hypothetical protein